MNLAKKIPHNFHRQRLICEVFIAQSTQKKRVQSIKSIERRLNKPIESLKMKEITLFSRVMGCNEKDFFDDDYVYTYSPEGKWRKERKEVAEI